MGDLLTHQAGTIGLFDQGAVLSVLPVPLVMRAIGELNATALQHIGNDPTRLIHRFQGRDYRFVEVHANVVTIILT